MNPLKDMPRTRKAVYRLWWVLSLAQIAVIAGYAAVEGTMPAGLVVALAVYVALSGPIGYTAEKNVTDD